MNKLFLKVCSMLFMTMSALCLFSHGYLLLNPYNYFSHVPNFCIVLALVIIVIHWKKSKETCSEIWSIKVENIGFIENKLLILWFAYVVFNNFLWMVSIETNKFPAITQDGVSSGIFFSLYFYILSKNYKYLSKSMGPE